MVYCDSNCLGKNILIMTRISKCVNRGLTPARFTRHCSGKLAGSMMPKSFSVWATGNTCEPR